MREMYWWIFSVVAVLGARLLWCNVQHAYELREVLYALQAPWQALLAHPACLCSLRALGRLLPKMCSRAVLKRWWVVAGWAT